VVRFQYNFAVAQRCSVSITNVFLTHADSEACEGKIHDRKKIEDVLSFQVQKFIFDDLHD
jgi:hypothetical protein